ncbi:BMP family ABC transporter substrate-binding protein [Serinicoccus sp. CNJ-927]|uniref:BMP family lipoprotein n=1 Tax=unclassified Serinicoccus TaxID=2643101 RepID=UPI0009614880|nr:MULTISPECIES: BMP family ABC transporter substrate-binding protein [unclassified Serinicoccus]OLT17239.1 BMP family ABC transporter substrate-binding protein [Serinicoccus sp. CUA-874]OLT45096.1 BMP family ABC transporter substrate-binding protein [Serinicoccus sp. CNJ-927]
MRRVLKLATAGAAATLLLAACGEAPTEDESNAGGGDNAESSEGGGDSEAASDFKACMVSDAGGFDDQSFNQSGKEGLDAAAEALSIETVEVESQADTDYATNVAGLVDQGCSITIGVGFLLEDAIQTAAEDNTDTNFALIDSAFSDADSAPVELDNAKPILFNTAEASFLAGYLSAGMTETGTVATFGGLQIPSVSVFMDGFADGVDKFNEDNGTDVNLLGWDKGAQEGAFSGDFDNQSQGQTLTEQFISQGADIVMPVAGPVGLGAAAAAEGGDDVKIVWVDSDGYLTATEYSDLMLTSVMKQIGPAVEQTITETVDGGFSNEPYVGTLENDGVGLAPYHDMEGDVAAKEVTGPDGETMMLNEAIDMLREMIISGDLTVESENSPQQ